MTRTLDLDDIQGNIVRAYGKFGYPKARYFFLHVKSAPDDPVQNEQLNADARNFIRFLRRDITTAQRWKTLKTPNGIIEPPKVTLNVGFSWRGLVALGLPTRTLAAMPPEFIDGMARRAHILGDVGDSALEKWDQVWRDSHDHPEKEVHIWISMNAGINWETGALYDEELEEKTNDLKKLCDDSNGAVTILSGVRPGGLDYQDAAADLSSAASSKKEHFGYADGFGNPVFKGQYPEEKEREKVVGRGKYTPLSNKIKTLTWKPLAAGEFLLGYPDEAQELPLAAMPASFVRNGTFMAFRKLHQNTKSFDDYMAAKATDFVKVSGLDLKAAKETLSAKMVGRWRNGVPLMVAPTWQDLEAFNVEWQGKEDSTEYKKLLIDFTYAADHSGEKCPVSAHIRRGNPRDMIDPAAYLGAEQSKDGSALINRRRILRRGLPYGTFESEGSRSDDNDHGIIFMAVCASLFRQFEFVQQQWMQYGMDFRAGNDTCPIIGNHDPKVSKFVIDVDPDGEAPPFIADGLPQFVTTRGGEYFFIPSMTALRMIAMGTVDPTT